MHVNDGLTKTNVKSLVCMVRIGCLSEAQRLRSVKGFLACSEGASVGFLACSEGASVAFAEGKD
jgi:hypothetical protein